MKQLIESFCDGMNENEKANFVDYCNNGAYGCKESSKRCCEEKQKKRSKYMSKKNMWSIMNL